MCGCGSKRFWGVCGNSELVGLILRGGDWLTRPPSKGVAKSLPGKGSGKAE